MGQTDMPQAVAGVAREGAPLLVVQGVTKRFGPTLALADVTLSMRAGEVHALMGENGAGKSTLGKAIAGLHKPDAGSITLDGRALVPGSVKDAYDAGVRIVHQELAQCPNLTVAENLCLHAMPRTSLGLVDDRTMAERASRLLKDLAPEIDVQAPLGTLAPGRRQIVQIASSLDDDGGRHVPRVVVFDEPTSSLSVAEADRLMAIIRRLAGQGLLAIYVSHRMNEIFSCCDRVSVLRDGRFVATNVISQINQDVLVSQMIGRTIDTSRSLRRATPLPAATLPTLEVSAVSSPGRLHNVSLSVRAGEVLGIGGLVGAGRSELLDAIFGLDERATGDVRIAGRPLAMGHPRQAIALGMGYVPEDRRLQGLYFQMGIDENVLMPSMPLLAHLGVRNPIGENRLVREQVKRLQVKAASTRSLPGELSGGNQQKVLIARWLLARTKVLLLDEPTRGIDVGTKAEIYKLVRQAADDGLAVLLISSEMPELLALSDRIVVMANGRLTGELQGEQMTQEAILRLAALAGEASPALAGARA
jgi:ABC-type sugar transport system ATPase subunit